MNFFIVINFKLCLYRSLRRYFFIRCASKLQSWKFVVFVQEYWGDICCSGGVWKALSSDEVEESSDWLQVLISFSCFFTAVDMCLVAQVSYFPIFRTKILISYLSFFFHPYQNLKSAKLIPQLSSLNPNPNGYLVKFS